MSQKKLQTMIIQNFWGVKEAHYGIVQVVNSLVSQNWFFIIGFPALSTHYVTPFRVREEQRVNNNNNSNKGNKTIVTLILLQQSCGSLI